MFTQNLNPYNRHIRISVTFSESTCITFDGAVFSITLQKCNYVVRPSFYVKTSCGKDSNSFKGAPSPSP
jgi:hypothetical protein